MSRNDGSKRSKQIIDVWMFLCTNCGPNLSLFQNIFLVSKSTFQSVYRLPSTIFSAEWCLRRMCQGLISAYPGSLFHCSNSLRHGNLWRSHDSITFR